MPASNAEDLVTPFPATVELNIMDDIGYYIGYFNPGGVRNTVMSVSVCLRLSVRSHISKTTRPNFIKLVVRVDCGRGAVLRWRRCDMLAMYFRFCG